MDIKSCCSALSLCGSHKSLELESINYRSLELAVKKFIDSAKDVDNDEHLIQLSSDLINYMRRCTDLYKTCKQRFTKDKADYSFENGLHSDADDDDVKPTDSISQVASRYTATSSKSSLLKLVELERKQAEIEQEKKLAKARKMQLLDEAEARKAEAEAEARKAKAEAEAEARTAKAKAEAEVRKAEAEAEAEVCNARLLAEAEEAEALAQISLESIKLKAEEN